MDNTLLKLVLWRDTVWKKSHIVNHQICAKEKTWCVLGEEFALNLPFWHKFICNIKYLSTFKNIAKVYGIILNICVQSNWGLIESKKYLHFYSIAQIMTPENEYNQKSLFLSFILAMYNKFEEKYMSVRLYRLLS